MRNFLRLAQGINVMPLLLQVYEHEEVFHEERIRQTYAPDSPHREVEDVLLRFSDTQDERIGDELQCEWFPAIAKLTGAKDIAFAVMTAHRGEQLGRVMITRLAPGKQIYSHADIRGRYANFYSRFHIPLQSDPGVLFYCGEESVQMAPGEVWWFNGHLQHAVVNNSPRDRIQLIVDIKT